MTLSLKPAAVTGLAWRALTLAALLGLQPAAGADTLRDIYELAVKNDAKLQGAAATYRANLEAENQARARLLPQINGEGSFSSSRRVQDSKDASIRNGVIVNSDIHSNRSLRDSTWNISLSQPLFDLPSWFSFRSGKELSKQAEAEFLYEQQDLIVRVAEAYFEILRQHDNAEAALAEEEANKEQFEQARERFKSGLIAITDVHEARAAYDLSTAQRILYEGKRAAAYEALTFLTGRAHANVWLLNRDFPVAEPQPLDRAEWVQFALSNNYALKAALYAMDASRQNAASKLAEHLPKLSGSIMYQESNVHGTQTVTPDSPFLTPPGLEGNTSTAMVKLTVPMFSSGYTSSQSRQASEQYNAALQKKIETERSIVQNTRAKHIAALTHVQRVSAQAQAIDSAQSALDASAAGYRAGTRSIVDVLQTRRTLFAAQRDHANARYDYVMDLLQLKELAGTLGPQDIYELNRWLVAPAAPTASNYRDPTDG